VKFNKAIIPGLVIFSTLSSNSAHALPMDWNGVFGVDTHLLNNIRRTGDQFNKFDNNNNRINGTEGTQGIQSGEQGTHFQTYIFKLSPQIIVNDAVTFKSELSTGYIRGGFLGGDTTNSQAGVSHNSYFFTTPAQRSGLNINQAYMELYADTALIRLGRMSKHYGTGAILNGGNQAWDRFLTIYDGIDAEMKIGNFSLTPHWAKISSFNNGDLREGQGGQDPTRNSDVREMGLIAKYDNRNRDLVVSVLYARRYSEFGNSLYQANPDPSSGGAADGRRTEITIIDPYIAKKWNRLTVALEAPMISGNFGDVYGSGGSNSISANSYILEARYDLGPKWDVGLFAGQISGTQGSGTFGATYLHPNYQVADLMFRYHWQSFNEPTGRSIFDSSITNSRYLRAFGNYKTDKWTFKTAFIMARAMETAQGGGSAAYHHEEQYSYTSQARQSNDMGFELDFGFDYRWNPNVIVSGYYGYWFVGDYYSFTNSATTLGLQNVHGGGVRATLEF
jgi:hypothetical protein